MRLLFTKKLLSIAINTALSLIACQQDKHKYGERNQKARAQFATAARPQYAEVKTWLDDFKNFRTAVNQKDLQTIKTFFSFPVIADTTGYKFSLN